MSIFSALNTNVWQYTDRMGRTYRCWAGCDAQAEAEGYAERHAGCGTPDVDADDRGEFWFVELPAGEDSDEE